MTDVIDYKKIVDDLLNLDNSAVNIAFIQIGLFLDIFVDDERDCVRMALVKRGYRLHDFIKDKCPAIRKEVLRHGIGINELYNDREKKVRDEAEKQQAIDILKRKRVIPANFNDKDHRLSMFLKNTPNGQTMTESTV